MGAHRPQAVFRPPRPRVERPQSLVCMGHAAADQTPPIMKPRCAAIVDFLYI
jgi:hypothetical protein